MPVRHRFEEQLEAPLPDNQDLQSVQNFPLYKHEAHLKSQMVFFIQSQTQKMEEQHKINSHSQNQIKIQILIVLKHKHQNRMKIKKQIRQMENFVVK